MQRTADVRAAPPATRPSHWTMRTLALVLACVVACGGEPASTASSTRPEASAAPSVASAAPLAAPEQDFEEAMKRAAAEKKVVFADVWAPWCAPCLSFRAEVLEALDQSAFASRVVFVAIDTDKPEAAPFLERYGSRALPTLYVILPDQGNVLALRTGYMPLQEFSSWLSDAVEASTRMGASGRPLLMEGHHFFGKRRKSEAAALFLGAAESEDPFIRDEGALAGTDALAELGDYERCAIVARSYLPKARSASVRLSLALTLVRCGARHDKARERDASRRDALDVLPAIGADKNAGAYTRSEALGLEAELHRTAGDEGLAKAADAARLTVLEDAARAAKTVEQAQAFDHARVKLYVALGRQADAITLLEARVRERPDTYETHGRLGTTLLELGEGARAVAPLERAVELAYGPPRLVYMGRLSAALETTGARDRAMKVLEEEVAGWAALPAAQREPSREADAKSRLSSLKSAH